MNVNDYILPVFDSTQCGCGFFIGNYFITAGHVVLECKLPLHIIFKDTAIYLDLNNLIHITYTQPLNGSSLCGDYAIFLFHGINSPLTLAEYVPLIGQKLECITYDTIVSRSNTVSSIFSYDEKIEIKKTSAIVREGQRGNFFACDTNPILRKGNSGSPLIDENDSVVGVLHGGNTTKPEFCVFQNSLSIKQNLGILTNKD